jgi:glucose/arabinose dehydrogenase/plastocyanin
MKSLIALTCVLLATAALLAQSPNESDYYVLQDIKAPDGVVLEVGGLAFLPDERLGVATRRGEVWLLSDWQSGHPQAVRFAQGLHEPLGLAWHEGSLITAQRSELTRLTDANHDDRADRYQTVVNWPLTTNYHEYSYGPLMLPDGDMLLTLNVGWEGKGVSKAPWRGWLIRVNQQGEITPLAAGLRSPAGLGLTAKGEIFYAENQGDWVGSGRITHLERGDFAGHPASLAWADQPGSPLSLDPSAVRTDFGTMYQAAQTIESLKLPAVWFPHGLMGISTSDILAIPDQGFGPFGGQLLVGDQGQSRVMRVYLEQVGGAYQGACFPFREGFASGILRLRWAPDGSLMVGMTSRGWKSTGPEPFGLQRLRWTGETPFELLRMEVQADGFLLTFTQPVDSALASRIETYQLQRFTYRYGPAYGSPALDVGPCPVRAVTLLPNGRQVRLRVDQMRLGYVHELTVKGLHSEGGTPLLHPLAYYTLHHWPAGAHQAGMHAGASGAAVALGPDFDPQKHRTQPPTEWKGQVDQRLLLHTQPGLRYDQTELRVRPGSRVALRFVNPDDMQHNLVITRPGQGQAIGKMAMAMGLSGSGQHYIPRSEALLFHSSLLEPNTEETIYFQAPKQPGRYAYVCTVPGHAVIMNGVLVVE